MKETIDLLGKIITNILTALYEPFGFSLLLSFLAMFFYLYAYEPIHAGKRRSYRTIGNLFPEQRLVSFQIQEALPIENGRVLDETVSPTFALCRAEGSPSQNNPTPEEKANSGAV